MAGDRGSETSQSLRKTAVKTERGDIPEKVTSSRRESPKDHESARKAATSCAHCGGPTPPPKPIGRPPLYCSLMCRRKHQWHADRIRWAEERRVEEERRAKEEAERAAAELRSNLAAGGVRRLQQLQDDAQDAQRCGWFEPGDDDVCQRRVNRQHLWWCREHMDREEKLEEERIEAEFAEFEAEEKAEAKRTSDDPPRFVRP